MLCFGLGHPPVIASGQYTITPLIPATDGTELPYFSFIQQIRPGGSSVLDQMLVGCAVKAWKLAINSSPGRGSAMCTADCWTSGKYRSEEHTSELQSLRHLVCRLLLE